MRFSVARGAVLACLCALTALAQQRLTIDQLKQFIKSSIEQKMSDRDVAGFLATVKLTERLTPRMVEEMQGEGAGPKTTEALAHLAEVSATLPAAVAAAPPPKPKPIPPPSYEEQQKVLDAVREYALNYSASLPDFICLEVTRRYHDLHFKPDTEGSWAISDRLAEKLTYFDQKEKYEAISHNDTSLYGKSVESLGGSLSRGDFGSILREIFVPESDAEFRWERWGNLDGHLMHVYTYHIDQPHSKYTIDFDNHAQQSTPGYHGEIFVEQGSNVIMRITLTAEPPVDFPIQNVHQVLDYRYIDLSGQKFLLPQNGTVISRVQGVGTKNEIDFRGYKRYSADATITFSDVDEPEAPKQPDPPKQ
jgi:hypothetical protein